MSFLVAIVYNEPTPGRYENTHEIKAVTGVLSAVKAAQQSLTELGYKTELIPLALPLDRANETIQSLKVDLVFNLFEGFPGFPETEAWLPETLRERKIPFTGCSSETLKMALNKGKTKELLSIRGILTPPFQILSPENINDFNLTFPCIVKPLAEDASHGITENSVVNSYDQLKSQVGFICRHYRGQALVETFIEGREFNVTVMGNSVLQVLPVSEILFNLPLGRPRILTYEAKWEESSLYYRATPVMCPAQITMDQEDHIRQIAVSAYKAVNCCGYARVDLRMSNEGTLYVIEINPNPDISPEAGTARQAKAAGMSYTDLIRQIVNLAMELK